MPAKKSTRARNALPVAKAARTMDFTALVDSIRKVHAQRATQANRAVNVSLTLRNWVIGAYIHHYELHGQDRAKYGDGLIDFLAATLAKHEVSACERQRLYSYLSFYRAYPQIEEAITTDQLLSPLQSAFPKTSIVRSATGQSVVAPFTPIVRSVTGQLSITGQMLLDRLSYTHLELLVAIRDPYIFEFLGLRAKDAVAESDLEAALVDNLREFLLELGHGFCLEAQQKSIIIGKTRGFVDLVFYHRILKCHVLVELKVDSFRHEHLGQLNTYVTWYSKHMVVKGDNPPVGLLLCTDKDHALVQYATASLNNRLFVSKYAVELPSKIELEKFIHKRHLELDDHA